jgi:arylsulfatase A-like enzyme
MPNIVLIFADDLGWQDTGFAGSDYAETPNLDRLAAEGMIFWNAYAAAGNCQPSRACLISGHYTPRHHVYAVGSTDRGPKNLMRMIPIPNKGHLPAETRTLGEALKAAGYATGLFGKQHLRAAGGGKAEESGFDVVKVSQHGLDSKDPNDPKGIFSISGAACEFIEANRDRPFFAYLPHFAIHSKLQARAATLARFKSKPAGKSHDDPLFAACIADLDAGVGQVLDKLEALGLADRTLVVFTSDNGGTDGDQEPLRGKKGCYYEGGIRVPMAVHWPGVVKPGATSEAPVVSIDLYPTFLAAAGRAPAEGQVLDGTSLLPLLRGEEGFARSGGAIFWHFPGYLDRPVRRGRDPVFRTRPVSVIRRGDWKLHLYHEEWQLDGGRDKLAANRAVELYDLASDPGERNDLALKSPDRRDKLLAALLAWIESTGALLPEKENPDYDPAGKATQAIGASL